MAVVVGAQHAVAFQHADRFEQLGRFAFYELGKHSGRDTATEGGGPGNQDAGAFVEAGQAITDERVEATGE
ncbi:MAG TPA: hypothetical protein VJQ84_04865 [Solirubrobacterales bacterium]|nr:hypothetical protein [Solirubrobacterales bacterium]